MKFPDKLDVLTIHAKLIAETGGTMGLRDEALFESALMAAENRHWYDAADVVSCAAAYAYHLTQAHAFLDGNKRIGAAITEVFLETNGIELTMTNQEVVDLFLGIAASKLSRDEVDNGSGRKLNSSTRTISNLSSNVSPPLESLRVDTCRNRRLHRAWPA